VVCVLVTLAPNRLKALPHNRGSGHQIANAKAGGLLGLGWDNIKESIADYEIFPQPELNNGQPDDGEAGSDEADAEEAAGDGVCFHGPTLAPDAPKVLIERNSSAIDGNDEERKGVSIGLPQGRPVITAMAKRRCASPTNVAIAGNGQSGGATPVKNGHRLNVGDCSATSSISAASGSQCRHAKAGSNRACHIVRCACRRDCLASAAHPWASLPGQIGELLDELSLLCT